MFYVLNLFRIKPGCEDKYLNDYLPKAVNILESLGGKLVVSASNPLEFEKHPGKKTTTDTPEPVRDRLLVIQIPNKDVIEQFMKQAEPLGLNQIREQSTENYIWKMLQPWEI